MHGYLKKEITCGISIIGQKYALKLDNRDSGSTIMVCVSGVERLKGWDTGIYEVIGMLCQGVQTSSNLSRRKSIENH